MDKQRQEIKDMADFIVTSMKTARYKMDYSIKSVKYLDDVLDKEIKSGKAVNPDSTFEKMKEKILFGMSAYLTEVIIKNTKSTSLQIDVNDPEWRVNFKLISENEWTAQPGMRVIKRVRNGREDELYAYPVSACKYFNEPKQKKGSQANFILEMYVQDNLNKKSWWQKLFK